MDVLPTIEANARTIFSEQDAGAALAMLAGMAEPSKAPEWVAARARVQIAALMLSTGNIELLRAAIKQSQVDWRDTLTSAGLDNANWPSVANAAGLTVPQGSA
jgi:hypothetical protein